MAVSAAGSAPLNRGRFCACGFDPLSVWPMFGPEWHERHRDAHVAAFSDLDPVSLDNLARFIDDARRKADQ